MTVGKRGRKPKYNHIVLLKGVNAREVFKDFKQSKASKPDEEPATPITELTSSDQDGTLLSDISKPVSTTKSTLDTVDDGRKVIMADHVNYGCLPDRTDLWCRWCQHSFNTSPIGIPIGYCDKKPDKIQLTQGEISGVNDYFLTDKVVCSFPCALSYIKENQHKTLYKNSIGLLHSLYYKIYGAELRIKPAESIDCLKVHGGDLDIKEYRDRNCQANYIITDSIKRPYMVAVGRYTEQTRCGIL